MSNRKGTEGSRTPEKTHQQVIDDSNNPDASPVLHC